MLMGVIVTVHTIVCIGLGTIILMQSGRGGGLTESFSSAESIFGAQTSAFLIKATSVFAGIFLVTCLSLAFLSSKKDKSLMEKRVTTQLPTSQQVTVEQVPEAPEQVPEAPAPAGIE